eukprot:Hpha_TRINITY_DN16085_c1_g12::TRINITY_DN16085_c1_g12_i1::g.118906::m.118906/K14841/NSA1, WDR74; ribosome biogenesis protein NSA1
MSCIIGGETGLIKVVDWTKAKQPRAVKTFGEQSRAEGVAAIVRGDSDSEALVIRQNGVVGVLQILGGEHPETAAFRELKGELPIVPGCAGGAHYSAPKKQLFVVAADGTVVTCDRTETALENIETAEIRAPIACSSFYEEQGGSGRVLVAAGGRDNDTSVYVASDGWRVEWRARNQPITSLGLQRKMHPLAICWLPRGGEQPRLGVVTALQELRLYDWLADESSQIKQRKGDWRVSRPLHETSPISDWLGESCISCMASVPGSPDCAFLGDTTGSLFQADLTNGRLVKKYRGGSGAIYSISTHPSLPFVVNVGLSRKALCHEASTGKMVSQLYLKQRLNAALWLPTEEAPFQDAYTLGQDGKVTADDENEAWVELDEVAEQVAQKRRKAPEKAGGEEAPPSAKRRRKKPE